jgi:hypothetical protein
VDDHVCLVSLLTHSIARWSLSALSPDGDVGQALGEAVEPMDLERDMVLHEKGGTTPGIPSRVGVFGASSILPR